jgi:hypothetical protein
MNVGDIISFICIDGHSYSGKLLIKENGFVVIKQKNGCIFAVREQNIVKYKGNT